MHSTNVAGVMAAVANNGAGIAGIDWGSNLWAWDTKNHPANDTDYLIISRAMIAIADNGYKVVNNSYGSAVFKMRVAQAFVHAYNRDVVSVAAIGNDGLYGTWYPAAFPGVIAVGSIKWNAVRAEQSNMGEYLDLVAPSANESMPYEEGKIYTTNTGGGYGYWWGTSLAAPQVTGVVSLLRVYRPELSNDDVEWILKYSAWDPPASLPGPDSAYGYGLIQADSAFALLELPYTFHQDSVVGASVAAMGEINDVYIRWAPDYGYSHYQGRLIELRADVTFSKRYFDFRGAWIRGSKSTGFTQANPNNSMHWAEFIPESLTENGGTLRTYVYELWNQIGMPWLGYFPAAPTEAVIAYSVLGEELLVGPESLQGPDTLEGMIQFVWIDTLTNETAWHIDRRVPPFDWENDYGVLPADSTDFVDDDLWGSASHIYRIRPSNAHQNPIPSRQFQWSTTAPHPPRNVQGAIVISEDPWYPASVQGGESSQQPVRSGSEFAAAVDPPPYTHPTRTLHITFDGPEKQAIEPSSFVIRAWPQGVRNDPPPYCSDGRDGQQMESEGPGEGCKIFEYYAVETPGAYDICLGRSNWQYDINVYSAGFNGLLSAVTPTLVVTTGVGYTQCDDPMGPADVDQSQIGSAEGFLDQNFPNPFNSATTIRFAVAEPGPASLVIYNVLGQRIRSLVEGNVPGGFHEVTWDGRDDKGRPAASGVYLYRIQCGSFVESRQLVLVK